MSEWFYSRDVKGGRGASRLWWQWIGMQHTPRLVYSTMSRFSSPIKGVYITRTCLFHMYMYAYTCGMGE